jgi:hypothetical protein
VPMGKLRNSVRDFMTLLLVRLKLKVSCLDESREA